MSDPWFAFVVETFNPNPKPAMVDLDQILRSSGRYPLNLTLPASS